MTYEEYFAQEMYFSESEQRFMSLDGMPLTHLAYAYKKLLWSDERAMFLTSNLYRAMRRRLRPKARDIRRLLRDHGTAAFRYDAVQEIPRVQSRFYRAAKDLGIKVTTVRDEKTALVRATVVAPEVKVIVRKRKVAT